MATIGSSQQCWELVPPPLQPSTLQVRVGLSEMGDLGSHLCGVRIASADTVGEHGSRLEAMGARGSSQLHLASLLAQWFQLRVME